MTYIQEGTFMNQRPNFTREQEEWMCYQIGEWYLEWKIKMIDWDNKTHMLGFAKEMLKKRLCDNFKGYADEI